MREALRHDIREPEGHDDRGERQREPQAHMQRRSHPDREPQLGVKDAHHERRRDHAGREGNAVQPASTDTRTAVAAVLDTPQPPTDEPAKEQARADTREQQECEGSVLPEREAAVGPQQRVGDRVDEAIEVAEAVVVTLFDPVEGLAGPDPLATSG